MIIQDPRNRLEAVPAHLRLAHIRAIALRAHIAALKIPVMIGIEHGGVGDMLNPSNNLNALVSIAAAPQVSQLIAAEKLLALVEASADYKEAVLVVEPLLALAAQDVADDVEAARAEAAAKDALDAAEAAARVKLEAKLASDPAVKAARAQLEALAPAAVETPAPVIVEAPAVELELASDAVELETADPLKGDFHD